MPPEMRGRAIPTPDEPSLASIPAKIGEPTGGDRGDRSEQVLVRPLPVLGPQKNRPLGQIDIPPLDREQRADPLGGLERSPHERGVPDRRRATVDAAVGGEAGPQEGSYLMIPVCPRHSAGSSHRRQHSGRGDLNATQAKQMIPEGGDVGSVFEGGRRRDLRLPRGEKPLHCDAGQVGHRRLVPQVLGEPLEGQPELGQGFGLQPSQGCIVCVEDRAKRFGIVHFSASSSMKTVSHLYICEPPSSPLAFCSVVEYARRHPKAAKDAFSRAKRPRLFDASVG